MHGPTYRRVRSCPGGRAVKNFFPIAVGLQGPHNAAKYRAAGINTDMELWRGPTTEHLAELKRGRMRVICLQNESTLEHSREVIARRDSGKPGEMRP